MSRNLRELATTIDRASDHSDVEALRRAIGECADQLKSADSRRRVALHYFQANAYQELYAICCRQQEEYKWGWEQDEAIAGILALRRAIGEAAFCEEDVVRRCQIRTNLANALSHVGRPVEAIEQWTTVLADHPQFVIALGNRANGLEHYARSIYDPGHARILLGEARAGYRSALTPGAFWDSGFRANVADHYVKSLERLEKIKIKFDPDKGGLGDTRKEQNYRRWALDQRLFLNPLNDAGTWPMAAHDVFHLPDHAYAIGEEPRFVQFYDLLKSEFVGARVLYYEAVMVDEVPFTDRGVLHFDSFDSAHYGIRVQKLKASYRLAYSLFDKIALFINDYFRLQRPIQDVSFRKIFYELPRKKGAPRALAPVFSGHRNWPLRGLFALSKDIFDPDFKETATPDAQMLDHLRNAAEHRFLSLHAYLLEEKNSGPHFKLTISAFEEKTLRILRLACGFRAIADSQSDALRTVFR